MLNEIYQSLDPIAFSVGPFSVRWYGIAYVLGFICAALVLMSTAKRWRVRVDSDALITIMLCVIVGVIVGGRLGYVLFYGDGYYLQHPADIFALSKGGMSFHGGLIGALLSGIVAAHFTHIPYLTLADLGCIGAPIGLFFGRCANFVNGELWGAPTDAAWGVVFGGQAGMMPRHPSQLYEAVLEGIVISLCCSRFRASVRRAPGGPFSACSSSCMGASVSPSSSCASLTCSLDICGAVGSRWGRCSRLRSLRSALACYFMRLLRRSLNKDFQN